MNSTKIKKETLCKHKRHKPNTYMLRKMFYSSSQRSDSCIYLSGLATHAMALATNQSAFESVPYTCTPPVFAATFAATSKHF